MQRCSRSYLVVLFALVMSSTIATVGAQGQGTTAAKKPAATTAAPAKAITQANVLQVMRGVLFPNSNVVFYAQGENPAAVKQEKDPSTAVNPLASTYGGWEAIQNSALALTESARLLEVPRSCSNGKPAPIQSATWQKGLAQLRAAGLDSYKAAQAKNMDKIVDAADKITTACATCHDKYREKTPRCTE